MKPLAILIAILALAGCGDDEREAPPADRPATGPLVVFERGGGIAHSPQRLEISRDGKATITIRTGEDVSTDTFTLTDAQLEDLEAAIADAEGLDGPGANTGCADCFIYSVRADGVDFSFDQSNAEDAAEELNQLVALLSELSGP